MKSDKFQNVTVNKYKNAGYGAMFYKWLFQYESFVTKDGKRATKRMP